MVQDKFDEIRQLKKNYFNLAEIHREEREALLRLINALSLLAPAKAGIENEIQSLKAMISTDGDLSIPELEDTTKTIKDLIVNKKAGAVEEEMVETLKARLIEACRIIKRIMASILDDFYPVTEDIKKAADSIR